MKQPVCVKVQPTSFPTFFDEMKPKLLSENPGMSKVRTSRKMGDFVSGRPSVGSYFPERVEEVYQENVQG